MILGLMIPDLAQVHIGLTFGGLSNEGHDRVVVVFLNKKKQLHTTRSWDFIGFPLQANRAPA